jgi:acyl-coenzyme A synthetase/AMP-(fatty) acid ligase
VIASRAVAMDPARLDDHMARHGVTMMQATPSTWRMLVDHGWRPARQPFKVLCGGEALPRSLAERMLERVPVIWNLYGPTETTIWSSVHPLRALGRGVPIGRPIANTRIYLLDDRGRPVPVGVPGELYIAGAGVARGYLGQPALTAERFSADPHGDVDARRYRTGDIARFMDDGCIEYLGRVDAQVKIRGHRIEPGEIETLLLKHEAIAAAVVMARAGQDGDAFLVAYLVPRPSQSPDQLPMALREYLLTNLPEFMVPSQLVMLDQLPLTPNGKVDRKALPLTAASAIRTDYVAPGDGLEAQVAQIWADVLQLERIGIFDNFFELGGHSLRVIQAVTRMREKLGVDVPLIAMFTYPTVKAFVANSRHLLPSAMAGVGGGEGYETGVF